MAGFDPWTYAEKYKSEHAHQTALFMWANMACRFGLAAADDKHSYTVAGYAKSAVENALRSPYGNAAVYKPTPQLKWLHAIHNQGHGDKVRGAHAKAEGVKPGVFDMFLPVPIVTTSFNTVYRYCGLYIELKVGKNTASDIQNEFSRDMKAAGYQTAVAWGWLEARNLILQYLGLTA